jgi:hypothetical protein
MRVKYHLHSVAVVVGKSVAWLGWIHSPLLFRGYLTFYHYNGWRLSDWHFNGVNYFFALRVAIWIHIYQGAFNGGFRSLMRVKWPCLPPCPCLLPRRLSPSSRWPLSSAVAGSPHIVDCHALLRGPTGEPACLFDARVHGRPLSSVLCLCACPSSWQVDGSGGRKFSDCRRSCNLSSSISGRGWSLGC